MCIILCLFKKKKHIRFVRSIPLEYYVLLWFLLPKYNNLLILLTADQEVVTASDFVMSSYDSGVISSEEKKCKGVKIIGLGIWVKAALIKPLKPWEGINSYNVFSNCHLSIIPKIKLS